MAGLLNNLVLSAWLVAFQPGNAQQQTRSSTPVRTQQARVTLSVTNGDVVETLRKVFNAANANYVIQAGVSGRTTAHLANVPFQKALAALIRASNPRQILRFDGSVYTVEPWQSPFQGVGTGIGRYGDWDYRDIKLQVNFVKASTAAAKLKALPMFAPEGGTRIEVHEPDNTLIVNAQEDIFRELKERLRLMDVAPAQAKLTFRAVGLRPGTGGRKKKSVWQSTCQVTVGTETHVVENLPGGGEWDIKVKPVVNGDASVTLDIAASARVRTGAGVSSRNILETRFAGSWRVPDRTTTLLHTVDSPNGSIRVFVAPVVKRFVDNWDAGLSIAALKSAIIFDPPQQPVELKTDIRRAVGDAMRAGFAQVPGFEVFRREEVDEALKRLSGTVSPTTPPSSEAVARALGANIAVNSKIDDVTSQTNGGQTIVSLRLTTSMEAPGKNGELPSTETIGTAIVGTDGEEAALLSAARKAAAQAVFELRDAIRSGTILDVGDGPIVLDLGSSSGVKTGDYAVVLRNGMPIGRLLISEVRANYSLARIITAPSGVQPEDTVFEYGSAVVLRRGQRNNR